MFKHLRLIFPSVVLLLVLFVSLASPMAAYAEDGAPPPPATEETTVPPDASTSPLADSEPVTVSEILEAVPEGTDVVVVDENGAALPLASENAAQIIAAVDPMWCPAGVLPGGAGCTTSFASSQALINNIDSSNPAATNSMYEQDGIIYFTENPGGSFILIPGGGNDGGAFSNLYSEDYHAIKGYNLTLQGGWSGINGDTNFTQTNFGVDRVQIGTSSNPWVGSLTINDISIDGTSTSGLTIYTNGDIHLNSVDSQNNAENGARLVNTSGNGNVTVQNSSFDANAGIGLSVSSNGAITLTEVNAENNEDRGARLDNGGTDISSITVEQSIFSSNGRYGLEALSNGDITLSNTAAEGNTESGARLDNCLANDAICTGGGEINVSGSSFTENIGTGLSVTSSGDITLNNITAQNNGNRGAFLKNNYTGASSSITVNQSILSFNSAHGLEAFSNGNITLLNVIADSNGKNGAKIEVEGAKVVCSQFKDNSTYGIDGLNVFATFTLDDVTFSGNGVGDYHGAPVITSVGCAPADEGGGDGEGENEGGQEGGNPNPSEPGPSDMIPVTGNLPLHIVSIMDGEQMGLNCTDYSGTRLILPNGDSVVLPCPIRDQGLLRGHTPDELPGQINDQFRFLSAMDAEVIRDGQPVSVLGTGMTIDFVIPDGQQSADLAILHWDESQSQWVEVPGSDDAGGRFVATSTFTGIYVLVTK